MSRATRASVWATVAAVCALAACSDDAAGPEATTGTSTGTSGGDTSLATSPPTQGMSGGDDPAGPESSLPEETEQALVTCEVDLPERWSAALEAGAVASADGGEQTVHRTLPDGTRVLRLGPNATRSALVWVTPDGQERVVQNLAEVDWWAPVTGLDSDGRYVAWSVVQWAGTEDQTTRLYVWDSANDGPPLEVAEGRVVGSPVLVSGAVVWVQGGDEPLDLAGLHAFDLASGTARVLAAGYLGRPVAVGDTVLVADQTPPDAVGADPRVLEVRPEQVNPAVLAEESAAHERPGDSGRATTAGPLDEPVGTPAPSVEDHEEVTDLPPELLEPDDGVGTLAASDDVVAWTDRAGRHLYVWAVGEGAGPEAVELPAGGVQTLVVAGRTVAWTSGGQDPGRYVLDLDSGGYALVRPGETALRSLGEELLVGPAEEGVGLPAAVLDPAVLPALPGCSEG